MRHLLSVLIFSLCYHVSISQNVGINTNTPDSSAILHLEANDMGFLPPRLTTTERDNINNPADGLVIFNTVDSTLQYYNGECWVHSYQKSCDECFFDLTLDTTRGTIDRVTSDSLTFTVNVIQTSTPAHNTSFFLLHSLPSLTTATMSSDTVFGSGSTNVKIVTSIFDNPGTYPIAIQGICNSQIQVEVFYLTIDSCYEVTINAPLANYDLQSLNLLPGVGTPICVVVDVNPGVTLTSGSTADPAYTNGALDPLSHVGLRNLGIITARGGNGGIGGSFATFGDPGQPGGIAIYLTCKTSIINTGYVFGGGGGGGSVGFGQSFSVPVIGSLTLAVGAGGGGGNADGQGGGVGGTSIPIWDDGNSATNGLTAVPGQGGILNVPISIPLGVATLTVTPNADGGDGGDYGKDGTSGTLTIGAAVTVPIVGTISLPIPPITTFPTGGIAGNAIKRNGNTLVGLPDGNYQTSNEKGQIGN